MLSCKEVTRLLSEGQDRKLVLAEKVQLEMHLAICKGCKNYKGQMSFLRTACQHYVKKHSSQQEGEGDGQT